MSQRKGIRKIVLEACWGRNKQNPESSAEQDLPGFVYNWNSIADIVSIKVLGI